MSHDAISGNRGRHAVGVMYALPAGEHERKGDRFGNGVGIGRSELLVVIGLRPTTRFCSRFV
jgi:hypothetical protein